MYGRFTEQYFNSFLPKDASQASQSILEAWVGLMGVPRDLRQLTVVFFLKQIDNFGPGRTNGIAMPTGPVNLSSASMKNGIVQIQNDNARRIKNSNQQDGQQSPQFAGRPASIGKNSMKSIVRTFSLGIGKWNNPCGGSPDRAENPAGHHRHKYLKCGHGENRRKLIDKRRPCLYSGNHTNLPVVYGCNNYLPLQSSEGWYFFVYDSWLLAAWKVRKFTDVDVTDDIITGRGGLALFVR